VILQGILEWVGPRGVGKTTLIECLMERIIAPERADDGGSVLLLDASSDQALSRRHGGPELLSVAELMTRMMTTPPRNQEAIDLAFAELPSPVSETMDLVCLGPLSSKISVEARDWLAYGLGRLLRNQYAFVIIDGYHEMLHALLPEDLNQPLIVLTPQFANVLPNLAVLNQTARVPALLLNRISPGRSELPESVTQMLAERQVRLIGQLADYGDSPAGNTLAEAFYHCLPRLDFPASLPWANDRAAQPPPALDD
jgi:hypothetical protein